MENNEVTSYLCTIYFELNGGSGDFPVVPLYKYDVSDEEIQRSEELQRYLSYYNAIIDSYKTGIFYPVSKQCDINACELH